MSEMLLPVEIIDDGSGTEMSVYQAACRCSNADPENVGPTTSDAFQVFWDPRFTPNHLHIQCFDCRQMYCPYGQCVPPPTAEVYPPYAPG
jgi:hypothetical protein